MKECVWCVFTVACEIIFWLLLSAFHWFLPNLWLQSIRMPGINDTLSIYVYLFRFYYFICPFVSMVNWLSCTPHSWALLIRQWNNLTWHWGLCGHFHWCIEVSVKEPIHLFLTEGLWSLVQQLDDPLWRRWGELAVQWEQLRNRSYSFGDFTVDHDLWI